MSEYQLTATTTVTRKSDGASIPNDPRNGDRVVYNDWVKAGGVPDPYVEPPHDFKADAQAALDASDMTMLRCVEADISVPAEWKNYRIALRDIMKSGVGPLPKRPPFPTGT